MGFFKKIKDVIKEVGLVNELCEHLRQMGLEATVVDTKSPEAIRHTPTLGMFGNPPLGCVKIEDRNFDFIEVYRYIGGGDDVGTGGDDDVTPGSISYNYCPVVRADVGELENELKADIKPIRKGFIRKEIVGLECKGKGLGQLLNADSELKKMLLDGGLLNFEIRPNKKDRHVMITPIDIRTNISFDGFPLKYEPVIGRKSFPTSAAIKAYDRIAQHIRSILSNKP